MKILSLQTTCSEINQAFDIALRDMAGNIHPHQSGLLEEPVDCLLAGAAYERPWTRDTAINTANAAALLMPEVSKNSILCCMENIDGQVRIGGQYWDAIILADGMWSWMRINDNPDFAKLCFQAVANSLAFFEQTEFDPSDGLFRGGACFADGVAAYPDRYVTPQGHSGILSFPAAYPERASSPGFGVPCKTLSTNCLYVHGYRLVKKMATFLNQPVDPTWVPKADALIKAINAAFWDEQRGTYRYLIDPEGVCDRQEGFGLAFAILYGAADAKKSRRLLENVTLTPHGISCLEPSYERYVTPQGDVGRHSGTVWPQVNAAFARAAAQAGRNDLAWAELLGLAEKVCRDGQFYEIYHPQTGEPYGGLQEDAEQGGAIRLWESCRHQTWCATGYLKMIFDMLLGMNISPEGLQFTPHIPDSLDGLTLHNLQWRNLFLTVQIIGRGKVISDCQLDGQPVDAPFVKSNLSGEHRLTLRLEKE